MYLNKCFIASVAIFLASLNRGDAAGLRHASRVEIRELQETTSDFDAIVDMLQNRFANTCTVMPANRGQTFVQCIHDDANAAMNGDATGPKHLIYCSSTSKSQCGTADFVSGDAQGNISKAKALLEGTSGASSPGDTRSGPGQPTEYSQLVTLLNNYYADVGGCRTEKSSTQTYVKCNRNGLYIAMIAFGTTSPAVQGVIYCTTTKTSSCKTINFVPGRDNVSLVKSILK